MLDNIKDAFRQFTFLTPLDLVELASVFKLRQIEKGQFVVSVGEYNYQAMKVIKGLLYHYVVDENGDEKALLFVPEGMNSGSLQTTMNRKPADENIVALENTIVIAADIRELDKIAANNMRILKMVNQGYKEIILEAAERIKFLIAHGPEERYIHFRKTYPDLELRVRQKDLASYLGVTATSLSRMRARMMERS
jgi:CRP-like cAMP-binding protein